MTVRLALFLAAGAFIAAGAFLVFIPAGLIVTGCLCGALAYLSE